MKISTLGYCIKQGIKNIQRNLLFSLASIGTMVACLFLFGIFYAILINMDYEMKDIQKTLTVSVFFEEGSSDDQIANIGNEIKKLENIDTINYVSADVAWKGYVEDVYKGDQEYVDSVFGEDNPLENSSSYTITLKDVSRQDVTVKQLEEISGVRKVNSSDVTAKSLNAVINLLSYISIGVSSILLLVSLFLISNTITIGISVRKEEIAIMKLIGATDYLVRAPFFVEGFLIGLLGSVLPLGVLFFLYEKLIVYVMEKFQFLQGIMQFLPAEEIFRTLIPVGLILGVGIGLLGSRVAIRKHLKV